MDQGWNFVALDHVQLAMPPGEEALAEEFYAGVLGFAVVAKPEAMAVRGGRWFEQGGVRIHLGVERDFHPARKAHPGVVVDDLDSLVEALDAAGVAFGWADDLPGVRRGHVFDCFGNRIELIDGRSL